MRKGIRTLWQAEQDIEASYEWYESKSIAVAEAFLAELDASYQRISDHPLIGSPLGSGVRRLRLRRFPLSLVYTVTDSAVVVVSIVHDRQKRRR